jgi:transposase
MDVNQITKIALAKELAEQRIPRSHIAEKAGISRATLYRWLDGLEKAGDLEAFLDQYLSSKKGPRAKRKVDGLLKVRIWNLREKYDCCGQKLRYFLDEEYGITLGVTSIYKILKEKYKLRSKWKKNQKRGYNPHALKPQEVIQMDSVDFGDIYAFTGVDIFSKEADVFLAPALTASFGYSFLKQAMQRRFHSFVDTIQTDGGHEFKSEFQKHVLEYAGRHRIAHPYRKNEQSYIESFNRTLRKECLGWSSYKQKEIPVLTKEVEQYLLYYHEKRPHLSLGMRPPLRVSHI